MKKVCALPECNEEFEYIRNSKRFCSKKCQMNNYLSSDEGKATRRKYEATEKYKEMCRKYEATEKIKETRRKYRLTDARKKSQDKYRFSERVQKRRNAKVAKRKAEHLANYTYSPSICDYKDCEKTFIPSYNHPQQRYCSQKCIQKIYTTSEKSRETRARNMRKRRKEEVSFALNERIRNLINQSIRKYIDGGKLYSLTKYGFTEEHTEKIIMNLKKNANEIFNLSLEEARNLFVIDHKIPQYYYFREGYDKIMNNAEIVKCHSPENLWFMSSDENSSKGDRIIKNHVEQVPKELWPKYFLKEDSKCSRTGKLVKDILELE